MLVRKANAFDDEMDLEMITLGTILLKKYGAEYITWESETLKEAIEEDFGSLGDLSWQKIQAIRLLHSNNSAWNEWEVFENICACNSNENVIFSLSQPPEPEDIAVTLEVLKTVSTDYEYHKDVIGYIASACLYDGLWCLPESLSLAQESIKDYDKFKGITRDYPSVKKAVKGKTKMYEDPSTLGECQANRILLVNQTLKEYNSKLVSELQRVASMVL